MGFDIAFFGSSLVSSYWNGAATYYRGLIRALAGRGHHVTFYEPDAYQRQQNLDIAGPDWADVVVYEATEAAARRCLAETAGADIIVKASGVGVFDELLEAEVLGLKTDQNLVVFWDVDAAATLDRVKANPGDAFAPLIPRYDMIMTYGGGPPVVSAYRELGARHCVPVYNALDPSTHHPVAPDARFECDLALLANRLPDREARIDSFFFEAARLLPEKKFLLGGSGWEAGKAMPPNVRHVGHVRTMDHNAFNCTPRAVLNVNRESMARYGYSPATRVFEAAGAGACIITDWFEGVQTFLEPQKQILVARDGAEVARHLEGLTAARARDIGRAGMRRALSEHTYDQRAVLVEKVLSERLGSARRPKPAAANAIGGK